MKRRLRIGLKLPTLGTLDVARAGNMQGDEQVARAWQKYLTRQPGVEFVNLYDAASQITESLDVLIHFNPFLELHEKALNVLYLQNAFPENKFKGGVLGVFRQAAKRFSGFVFTSNALMKACTDGAVLPFATDPEVFFPQPSADYNVPVAFVGNDLRGGAVNHRYLTPAVPLGLVIFGNQWAPPLSTVCRGKLPMDDLPKLYSSARINLNAHLQDHIRWATINLRIFDSLACGGFVISDRHEGVEDEFGDSVVCTEGDEDLWAKVVRYLADTKERERRTALGRKAVLSNHSYENRARELTSYLHAIL